MHTGNRLEYVVLGDRQLACILQFVGEYVEQNLGVRIGVYVPTIVAKQFAFEDLGIDEVAVVCQRNAEWRVDVERLGFGRR